MSHKYNVAVIGYGWAATAHIAAVNAGRQARVTDVWSSRSLSSAELTARHGSPIRVHSDLDAMLADARVHVVDITSYPNQHAEQFCLAARKGKHVIVEKPLAVEWKRRSKSRGGCGSRNQDVRVSRVPVLFAVSCDKGSH